MTLRKRSIRSFEKYIYTLFYLFLNSLRINSPLKFFGHNNQVRNLMFRSRVENFNEIKHFHCITNTTTPQYQKKTNPGSMKFTFFVNPSLVIITIYLVCLIYVSSRVENFQRNKIFSYMINMESP